MPRLWKSDVQFSRIVAKRSAVSFFPLVFQLEIKSSWMLPRSKPGIPESKVSQQRLDFFFSLFVS